MATMGKGQQKSSANMSQKAGFNGKQFATNYIMEIKCIAS